MCSKTMKLIRRITAWGCVIAMMAGIMVTDVSVVHAAGGRKIDVWDMGCVQESNTTVYTNNITKATWDNFDGVATTGTFSGASNTAYDFQFGTSDLTLTYLTNDRLFGPSTKNYGTNALSTAEYPDGYTAAGMYYCNGNGGENRRYFTMKNVVAGDKIVVYMTSNNNATDTLYFEYKGTGGTQKESAGYGDKVPKKYEFVAKYDGTYKIWTGTGAKPIYSRIMRVPGVAVSGSIDMGPCESTEYTIKFVNDTTMEETQAVVSGGTYQAVLAAGYSYTAVLSGVTGYGFTKACKNITTKDTDCITGLSGVNLVVEEKSTYAYTGSVTGFAANYDISKLEITMVPPADSNLDDVKLNIASDLSFSAMLEPEVEYAIVLSGVNDYEVISADTVNNNGNYNSDIEVGLKAKQAVSGKFVDMNGNEFSGSVTALTFTNEEDNYVYAGRVSGSSYSVNLREGNYAVSAVVDGYKTSTHVVVGTTAVTRDLLFVSTATQGALTRVSDIYVGYPEQAANYETVNEAVKAAKAMNATSEAERITIHIAPGTYREQIIIEAPYVTLVNDEPSKEVLLTWYYGIGYNYYSADSTGFYNVENQYDQYTKNSVEKWGTSTYVKKSATAFRAENITFEASFNRYITDEEIADGVEVSGKEKISFVRKYGADVTTKAATERAAAICVEADQSEFYNCNFLGSQDTLYTGDSSVHSYYKNCFIEGNTDFIFGDGDIVFDNCELSFYGYKDTEQYGYITAAKDAAVQGYLFRNCTVTTNNELKVVPGYLGRPWGANAKVTFINTKLERASVIASEGWKDWDSAKLAKNANYKEYNTTALDGAVVDTSSRTEGTVVSSNPVPDVTTYFGSWTPKYYVAEASKVEFTTKPYVVDNGDINTPYPGHTLTACYSLGEANDANDASIIKWYRVSGSIETLVKTSTATVDKTYQITSEDVGSNIKVVVVPTTVSNNMGSEASYTVEVAVKEGYEDPSSSSSDAILGDGVNIFLAGDSTVKDYSASGMYMAGKSQNEGSWGESLQAFFNADKVTIVNYANGGRSARNFINEGSLDKIAENISEGDYLFIQFGHNDCSNGSGYLEDRYVPLGEPDANGIYPITAGTKVSTPSSLASKYGDTFYSYDCGGTYKWYLLQYINAAREKGAIPVLVTPVSRMYYTSEGAIKPHHDSTDKTTNTQVTSNNAYVTAVKQLAEEEGVIIIDGFQLTKDMYENAYKADPSASGETSVYGMQVMASGEKTHSNKLGGFITAAYIASTIQNMNMNISYAVCMPSKVIGETIDGTTVYSVTGNHVLTAYDITSNYTAKADYWTGIGQDLINVIGKKAEELAASGGSGNTPDEDSIKAFVERLYSLVLNRVPGEEEQQGWINALANKESSGVDAGFGFVFSPEGIDRNFSNEEFVEILYNTFMGRPSDEGGKAAWISQLDAGVDREKVFEGFVYSPEFAEICNNYGIAVGDVNNVDALKEVLNLYRNQNADITKFVARCYKEILDRIPDAEGLEAWCKVILTEENTPRDVAAEGFLFSDEFRGKKITDTEYVQILYRAFLDREADETGLSDWTGVLAGGEENRDDIIDGFANSDEFKEVLKEFGLAE